MNEEEKFKKVWKQRLANIAPFVFLAVVLFALYLEYSTGYFSGKLSTVTVAVIDTGVDTRIPAIAARLSRTPGRNVFDNNGDISDSDGHGTKVALAILQGCGASGCRILPLKISHSGAGVTPSDLAVAIRYALKSGARVINISIGLSEGSSELESAIIEARVKHAVIVAAAGNGVSNPFRSEPLEKVYPQAYKEVVVVGAAKAWQNIDIAMNYGPALDLLVTGQTDDAFGSSYAAGTVSGVVADVLRKAPRLEPDHILQALRASARFQESLWPTIPPLRENEPRLGFGVLDSESFEKRALEPGNIEPVMRTFCDNVESAFIEVAAAKEVSKVEATWSTCGVTDPKVLFHVDASAHAKGRAHVGIYSTEVKAPEPELRTQVLERCKMKVRVSFKDGSAPFEQEVALSLPKPNVK